MKTTVCSPSIMERTLSYGLRDVGSIPTESIVKRNIGYVVQLVRMPACLEKQLVKFSEEGDFMERELNPSIIGQITELKCQLFLVEQGFNVLIPMGNHQKYDLVIEHNGKFTRIQVKHASEQDEGKSFLVKTRYDVRDVSKNQRVRHESYTLGDCDYIMTEFRNQFYIFPVFGTTETKLWLTDVKLKTQRKAEDYLAEKTLQEL